MTSHSDCNTVVLTTIKDLRATLKPLSVHQTVALVPTMGNLHKGHLTLVQLAKQYADIVVVSIFVNPIQFGVGEDLDNYPRTLDADIEKLDSIGTDFVFTPTVQDMYPVMPPPTKVLAGDISQYLCGQTRPTHFDGVGIVVAKLFNIVQPDTAVFGMKDYQQLAIIRQLVRDLSYDIDIVAAPIVRADDGLALSSRNQYLTPIERRTAPLLHQEIKRLANLISNNKSHKSASLQSLIDDSIKCINAAGFKIDYLQVRQKDLAPVSELNGNQDLVILVAAWLGKARLLDNQQVESKANNTFSEN